MFPTIALSPDVRLRTWGLLVTLAGLCVLWLGRVNAPARGLSADELERLWPWMMLGGFAGAHLYYLAAVAGWPWRPYPAGGALNPFSGTAIQGGLLGGAAAAAACLRRRRIAILPAFDALSPAGALAQAVTRVGCFAAGCCWGRRTGLPLGVVISSPYADPSAPRGVPLHPAQLYEAFLDAGLAVLLQRGLRREGPPGALFARYAMGSSLIRFVVEFFRGDDDGRLVLGLAHSQLTALAIFAAAGAFHAFVAAREEEIR